MVRESAGAESVAAVERDGAALLRFARDGGAKVGPLRFALFRHGQHDVRGVGFSAPAPANATVLAVPRALVLTGLDVAWTRTYAPGAWLLRGGGAPPPPPPSRTKWTRRVPHPVLIGHHSSFQVPRSAPTPTSCSLCGSAKSAPRARRRRGPTTSRGCRRGRTTSGATR